MRRAALSKSDHVVEVGPGRGALTEPLQRLAGRITAVEIDPVLSRRLTERFGAGVDVVNRDFTEFPLPDTPYKVVGNLPFNRTTDIVRHLTRASAPPSDAWLVIERDAARRLCGAPFLPESLPRFG